MLSITFARNHSSMCEDNALYFWVRAQRAENYGVLATTELLGLLTAVLNPARDSKKHCSQDSQFAYRHFKKVSFYNWFFSFKQSIQPARYIIIFTFAFLSLSLFFFKFVLPLLIVIHRIFQQVLHLIITNTT